MRKGFSKVRLVGAECGGRRKNRYFVKGRGLTIALLNLLLLGVVAGAQTRIPTTLNLVAAVEKAIDNNPHAKLADSKSRIAQLKIEQARSANKPIVQFEQSAIRSNNPVFTFSTLLEQGRFSASNFNLESLNHPDALTNYRSVVELKVPLFDQGQTRMSVTQAEIRRRQSDLQAESIRQNLRFEVVRGFYAVIMGTALLRVRQESVRSAEADYRKSRNMVDLGMTNEADSLIAEVELANAKHLVLGAENELVTTNAALKLLIGVESEAPIELVGDLREKYFPLADLDELIQKAFESRPDYQSSELAIEYSRLQTRSVKKKALPRIDLFGNLAYNSPNLVQGSTDYTIGVNLNYAIFDPGRKTMEAEATENETSAELEKQELADQIRLGVIRAWQNFKTAKSRIQVTIKSISQAEEALRIVRDRYHFGLSTFSEVIRAEAALVRAKHDQLAARYEYFVSYASVMLATGGLNNVKQFVE